MRDLFYAALFLSVVATMITVVVVGWRALQFMGLWN